MSKVLFDARRKLSQVNSLLRQDHVTNAIEFLQSGLKGMLSEPLLKSERREFERLLDEALRNIMSNQKIKHTFQLQILYQPGSEHKLQEDIALLAELMETEEADDAAISFQHQEEEKQHRLDEGEQALVAKNEDRANILFNSLTKEYEHDVLLLVNIAEAYEKTAHLDEAINFMEKAVLLDADSAYILNKCAILHRKKRDFASAEKFFNDAMKITPDDPHLYFNCGRLYADWEKWTKAHASAQKALELQPDFNEARLMYEYAQKRL
ncbi:MAG: hypothetical protein LBD82_08355 [Deltaproteobacteria bacterium]|jgi:tetratricopeptide (TPR) repeat protein|nr:hypothetical protein [Deltaproteobacteria bacterium]